MLYLNTGYFGLVYRIAGSAAASDLLGEVFGEAGRHARSAIGVPEPPRDVPVEIEFVVED